MKGTRSQSIGCSGFQKLNRREALRVGSLAGLGVSLGSVLRTEAAQKNFESKEGTAKSVIQIILPGGIAAQESWNPQPESPLEYRGPFGFCKTKIPGIILSELFPEQAKIADKMCVVRSVVGNIPDHGLATYNMITGQKPSQAIKHPSVGSVVNHEFGSRNGLPAYIGVPDVEGVPGAGTGYLSNKYGAFGVGGDPAQGEHFQVRDLRLPDGVDIDAFTNRQTIRKLVNDQFRKLESDPAPLETMDSYYDQAYSMISSEAVRNAFDLSQEPEKIRERYGMGKFLERGTYGKSLGSEAGGRMLLARRLVEAGARFVSLKYASWDTHTQIRETYRLQMPAFDHAIATLISDLDDRGLLDSTLIWVAHEFGRTPKINASAGRDHWSRVFSMALAGGGLNRGQFYGKVDATSSGPADHAVPLCDLHSTIYKCIGINSQKELMAPGDRPIEIVNEGKPVEELLA
ncbi:MAG: DUF1501 domain-containing protein [Verrucomicrobiales bacterium]|nr:DUF1501 domain-containing protein [Verrucomicrobiales bacterium]